MVSGKGHCRGHIYHSIVGFEHSLESDYLVLNLGLTMYMNCVV